MLHLYLLKSKFKIINIDTLIYVKFIIKLYLPENIYSFQMVAQCKYLFKAFIWTSLQFMFLVVLCDKHMP